MTGSRLLVGVASVLAGTTVLFVVLGFVANPILLLAAVPFGAAAYLLWSHATGRLEARMRYRVVDGNAGSGQDPFATAGNRSARDARRAGPAGAGSSRQQPRSGSTPGPDRTAAASVLGVEPDADEAAVRRAFRQKAREFHPDAPGGDEDAFKRVRAAYETLRNGG